MIQLILAAALVAVFAFTFTIPFWIKQDPRCRKLQEWRRARGYKGCG